ncbi:MAG: acyl-CoA synthetase [Deltaproteobacteria bacterium]|nr:acyl-CoA synthetase [Deltaproteobacteria bacterium]
MLAVVGNARAEEHSPALLEAHAAGRAAVDAGFRVITGGLGGVMAAACRGAHASDRYRDGDTIGVVPSADPASANEWVDIVIATGLGDARNLIVANADVVVAIGGGAGTLSEIAYAWMRRRLIIAVDVPGWSAALAGQALDHRSRFGPDGAATIRSAASGAEAVAIAAREWEAFVTRPQGV